jgi:hypothetical protein
MCGREMMCCVGVASAPGGGIWVRCDWILEMKDGGRSLRFLTGLAHLRSPLRIRSVGGKDFDVGWLM